MKYFTFILLLLGFSAYSQITGNLYVKDSSAVKLDTAAVNSLMGKWKLLETVEFIDEEEQKRDRGIIVEFSKEGYVTSAWCSECPKEEKWLWEILHEQTIRVAGKNTGREYLAGESVLYKLSDTEMVWAKVFTSTGSWKKLQYFSRNVKQPAVTETSYHCTNCIGEGEWCWGDKPEGARENWVIVNDLINQEKGGHHHLEEIVERMDWLLTYAPCLHPNLYLKAADYYGSLLEGVENRQARKLYKEKLKRVKKQQQLYFKK